MVHEFEGSETAPTSRVKVALPARASADAIVLAVAAGLAFALLVTAVVCVYATYSDPSLPLSWLLLGIAVYPLLIVLGWRYVLRAERNERDFADVELPKSLFPSSLTLIFRNSS